MKKNCDYGYFPDFAIAFVLILLYICIVIVEIKGVSILRPKSH